MKLLAFQLAASACCLALVGCDAGTTHERHTTGERIHSYSGEYPIMVVCTTGQIAEMIDRIGGDRVEVTALMGPGVDPHIYKPVASDVSKLSEADIIFYNGMHLEGRMADLFLQMARNKATFAVTEGIETRNDSRLRTPTDFEGLHDPHVWHDAKLWSECVKDTADTLAKFDTAHASDYKQNAAEYVKELAELDTFCKTEIAKIPSSRRVLITAHDAFGYFGEAYGLEVHGLKGISTDEEKDMTHQEELQAMILQHKIPAVFVESAVSHRTVESLVEPCRAAGHDLQLGGELFADAMGQAGTEEGTYAGMIRHNVNTIVSALAEE